MTPTAGSNFSRYPIPDDLSPDGICCVSVPIPDDPQWFAMLSGALWRLSLQTNWERDAAHSAKIVAARWREIWMEVQGMAGCCGPGINDVTINTTINVQNQQYLFQLLQIYIAAGFDIDVAFPETPDDYDSDPGDVGPEVAQRNRALCLAVESWVNEVCNRGLSWIESQKEEVAALVAAGVAVPFIPVYAVIGAFIGVGVLAGTVIRQLANNPYRAYLSCAIYEALIGEDSNSTAAFYGALDSPPVRPPPPQDPLEDGARDLIEAWVRVQLNSQDNYLGFIKLLNSAMTAAAVLTDNDCGCLAEWEHTFLNGEGLQSLDIIAWPDSPFPLATYNAGDDEIEGDCVTDAGLFSIVDLQFASRTITRVTMLVGVQQAGGSGSGELRIWDGVMNVGDLLADYPPSPPADVLVDTGTISITTGQLQFETVVGTGSGSCAGGRNDILEITIYGEGDDPF